jgi:hypothetical protein
MSMSTRALAVMFAVAALAGCSRSQPDKMSFFVTSVPAGDGGSIGGLAGADAHCQRLAESAGSRGRQWRAYLSTAAEGAQPAIHARDRIGKGPWFNSRGEQIAANLEELHGAAPGVGRRTVLPESGERVQFPHDVLTGSNPDGTLAKGDMTCRNWTSTTGYAMFGHSDRQGGRGNGTSWNSAHQSEGCTSAAFAGTGGSGRFYCFAID